MPCDRLRIMTLPMAPLISIIIPNHNGGATLGNCLHAAFASRYANFEVLVVDDCSADNSLDIIRDFPRCKLHRLQCHAGAAVARNTGARHSAGEILFFTDADCLLEPDALERAAAAIALHGPEAVIGGTYTLRPHDPGFFSLFQSAFIHYSETKHLKNPDYIASHALVISAVNFRKSGGFPEKFMPIIEDVELSHRLRKNGYRLVMEPAILVRHIFNFTFVSSLRNAFRKSCYWTRYSLQNRDLLADSGTASRELKTNVVAWFVVFSLFVIGHIFQEVAWLMPVPILCAGNIILNRALLATFLRAAGPGFMLAAALYYLLVYPPAVGAGAAVGIVLYLKKGLR